MIYEYKTEFTKTFFTTDADRVCNEEGKLGWECYQKDEIKEPFPGYWRLHFRRVKQC